MSSAKNPNLVLKNKTLFIGASIKDGFGADSSSPTVLSPHLGNVELFTLPKATEGQDIHDEYMQYVNDVHWYGMNKLKSLYYFRSNAARNVENVNIKVPRIKLDDVECIACEG